MLIENDGPNLSSKLSHYAVAKQGLIAAILSVCLSVCVTFVRCVQLQLLTT